MNNNWRDEALCAETGGEMFFPERGESPEPAKRICAGCDVRRECLLFALANPDLLGVFGGTTEKERRQIRTQQRRDNRPEFTARHGTEAGYGQHRRRKEPACDECRAAQNRVRVDRKRKAKAA